MLLRGCFENENYLECLGRCVLRAREHESEKTEEIEAC